MCSGLAQLSHGHDGVAANTEIGVIPRAAASIDHPSLPYEHIESLGGVLAGGGEGLGLGGGIGGEGGQ